MTKRESQQAYWNSRASSWGDYGSPLIPNQDELEFQRQQLFIGGDVLVLGATPELCLLALGTANSVTAVDFAEDMIETLHVAGVNYVCQDWIRFLEQGRRRYDNILTDGGLACMPFPDGWNHLGELIYATLRPGGIFSPRVYLSNDHKPREQYDNLNLARFMPSMAQVDTNWMVRVNTHQSYERYNVSYAFPPREVVLRAFGRFALEDELVPTYEEGDRFVSFAFQKLTVE